MNGRGCLEIAAGLQSLLWERVAEHLAWLSERSPAFRIKIHGRLELSVAALVAIRFARAGATKKAPGGCPGPLRVRFSEPISGRRTRNPSLDGQASTHDVAFGIEVLVRDGHQGCSRVAQNAFLPPTS